MDVTYITSDNKTYTFNEDQKENVLFKYKKIRDEILLGVVQGECKIDIDSEVFDVIVKYMENHANDDEPVAIQYPLKSNDLKENNVHESDVNFITGVYESKNKDLSFIVRLVAAADDFGVKPLYELASAFIATFIRGQKAEKIREVLGLPDDLTAEEKDEIEKLYKFTVEL